MVRRRRLLFYVKLATEPLSDKATFEQNLMEVGKVEDGFRKSNSKCKGPEVGVCIAFQEF